MEGTSSKATNWLQYYSRILQKQLVCFCRKHSMLELWQLTWNTLMLQWEMDTHAQSKYESQTQMSDHPGDLIFSGLTTNGSHKAEETAIQRFFLWSKRLRKRAAASGGSSHSLFNYFFYVNFHDQDKYALVLYNNLIYRIKVKTKRKDCFLTVPPASKCYVLIWKFWLELLTAQICTSALSCSFHLRQAGPKLLRAGGCPSALKAVLSLSVPKLTLAKAERNSRSGKQNQSPPDCLAFPKNINQDRQRLSTPGFSGIWNQQLGLLFTHHSQA